MQYQASVITPHHTNYPNPIVLRSGEEVTIGREDEQYSGWIWVTTQSGSSGWAPIQILQISGETAVSLVDYTAAELNTKVDEILTVYHKQNGWLWVSNQQGQQGWIPAETVVSL